MKQKLDYVKHYLSKQYAKKWIILKPKNYGFKLTHNGVNWWHSDYPYSYENEVEFQDNQFVFANKPPHENNIISDPEKLLTQQFYLPTFYFECEDGQIYEDFIDLGAILEFFAQSKTEHKKYPQYLKDNIFFTCDCFEPGCQGYWFQKIKMVQDKKLIFYFQRNKLYYKLIFDLKEFYSHLKKIFNEINVLFEKQIKLIHSNNLKSLKNKAIKINYDNLEDIINNLIQRHSEKEILDIIQDLKINRLSPELFSDFQKDFSELPNAALCGNLDSLTDIYYLLGNMNKISKQKLFKNCKYNF